MLEKHVVHCTKDYNLFKNLEMNRGREDCISPVHAQRLENLIRERNLLEFRPILVDENYRVIDGHHRLFVAEKLGLPIYYIFGKDLKPEDAAFLTHGTVGWTTDAYVRFYASRGNKDYIALQMFMDEAQVNIYQLARILTGKKRFGSITGLIRSGKFNIDGLDLEGLKEYIDNINIILTTAQATQNLKSLKKGAVFLGCFLFVKNPKVDLRYFFEKLKKRSDNLILGVSHWKSTVKSLVEFYNKDQGKGASRKNPKHVDVTDIIDE